MPSPNGPAPAADQVFLAGVLVNAALAGVKLVVGFLAGSQALVADGVHSSSDVATNAGAWLSHRLGRRPPDEHHHFGHAFSESIAAVIIGLLMVAGGAAIIGSSALLDVHAERDARGAAALGVALAAIGAKLWLAIHTGRAAERLRSQALMALALDNKSDVYATVVAFAGILAALAGAAWVERVAAAIIGALILRLGFQSAGQGLDVLTDRVEDASLRGRIAETASRVAGVRGVGATRIHPLGPHHRVEIEIEVDGDLSVRSGHAIAHDVERALVQEHKEIGEVVVHVGPEDPALPGPADAGPRA